MPKEGDVVKRMRYCTVGALLMLGGAALGGAIVPPASAETRQLTYTLNAPANASFEGFVLQAEQIARFLVQQSFAEDPGVTAVSVRVVGEHNGSEAPLLYVTVSRADWQNAAPEMQVQHFGRSSAVLLGFTPAQNAGAAVISPPTFDQVAASLSDTEPNFYSQ